MDLILNDNSSNPTLCLNMIVKNECNIITRLFDSVISIIDCFCICDTGSTDNTIDLIYEYFKNKGIPGKVVIEPFKNFCHNRNFALQACLGMSDYVLLLDADMILEINNFNKSLLLNYDSFSILQGNDVFYYQNMRIVKNNGLYSYVGVTHEYINTPNNNKVFGFEKKNLFIKDIGDGGAKHDKFERDIKLLLDGIKEEPNNVRYYFYLANSFHDLGRFGEAINIYKKRIELGGWREEVWYSYYRIGLCFKNMGKIDDAIKFWMEGYNFYPERLEGIYEIIKHYRIISKPILANLFYQQAKQILNLNHNRTSYLFLHDEVYTSKIFYEFTVFAFYVGISNLNDEIVKVFNNSFDDTEINNMLTNMKFYKDILKTSQKFTVDNKILSIINDENTNLISSSSCLIPNYNNDGYLMNIRYVNYEIDENGNYLNCDRHIISVNKFVEFDKQLNVKMEKWMDLKFDNRRYIGIEDIRIFNDNKTNKLLFLGTGFHHNNKIGIVNGIYDIKSGLLNGAEINPSFCNSDCEKNWVFVDYLDSPHIVYNWHPLKICKMNENKNLLSLVETKNTPKIFSRIRGSSCGFKYSKKIDSLNNGNIIIDVSEDEIWFVTHIVSYETPRHYYHLIAIFDSNMNLLRYSAPFKFEGEPIEYCLSIIVEDERVLINYSTWDRTTRIGVYDKKYIDSIVKYF
jgi:tetratricopeptide (TPR) repeat protein